MKKIRLFPLILLVCLVFGMAAPAAYALEAPSLDGQAAVLVDLDSGRVLYDLNKDERRAPASLTKIMTGLLALDAISNGRCGWDDMVTAQADCREGLGEDSSSAGINPGDVISMRDLLYCALISSANEACNIIASYLEGSVSAFVQKMNDKAAELGCLNTHFANTNGLPTEDHYSSAYDMYLITTEAMRYPDFMEIANTVSYTTESITLNGGEPIGNSNALINPRSDYGGSRYLYEYASGVKTGYTRAAGYCLISTAEKDGVRLMAVVMGCNGWLNAGLEEYRNFSDTISLYDWAFENFAYQTVLSTSEQLSRVKVELAQGDGEAILHAQQDVRLLLPVGVDTGSVETQVSVYDDRLVAPISAGTVLGEARVYVDGVDYGSVRLVTNADVELARGEFMKMRIKEFFSKGWVIAILVVVLVLGTAYIILITRYRKLRKKHLQERRRAEQRRRIAAQERAARESAIDAFDTDWTDIE
ncbi:MAG: D-alanyl-D-alanine carboxypeptidase [Oscillospiraceae bacterium]|nr:D-alanyl-D-alanine carboxypeptidase [Oscillospiraceae bacterium]